MAKIGKPVDRSEWTMTPPTINAYDDPQINTINFPAGILQPPFFEKNMEIVNFGANGMVIGHELTHGFDDQGRKFDAHGNLRDWWTAENAKQYDQRGNCISNEYTQEVPDPARGQQNGLLTQGEDRRITAASIWRCWRSKRNSRSKANRWRTRARTDDLSPAILPFECLWWCANVRPEVARLVVTTNRIRCPSSVSTMWSQTCRSLPRVLAARRARRWFGRTLAGFGEREGADSW